MTKALQAVFAILPRLLPPEGFQAVREILEIQRGQSKAGDKDIDTAQRLLEESADYRSQQRLLEYAMRLGEDDRRTYWQRLLEDDSEDQHTYANPIHMLAAATEHAIKSEHRTQEHKAGKQLVGISCVGCGNRWMLRAQPSLD